VNECCWTDKALGMDRPIARRDFLNGIAMAIGSIGTRASATQLGESWPQDQPGYYPPVLTGLRGSHPGSFENAHALRDGDLRDNGQGSQDADESYDLVVVGGGISGLAAAHFYHAARPAAKILILDNHDDFGGHAKRNEFRLGGKLHLLNGGTLEIDSPV
jgi:spermidine dehydrogenase